MKRTLFAAGLVGAFLVAGVAFAQTDSSAASSTPAMAVTFPIAELGNCASKDACKAYCDIASNQDACLSYAETHGLMPKDTVDKARAIIKAVGPGGCKGAAACKAYCADTSHEDACFAVAEKAGLVRAEEVSVIQDIKQNGGPGGCTTADACRTYCADTTHADECKAFAASHNLKPLPQLVQKIAEHIASTTEAKTAQINAILAKTAGPGGCTTADACRTYCADKSHQAECATFAQANGLTAPAPGMHAEATTTAHMMHPMMRPGSTTIPAEIRQRIASSTDKRGTVWPVVPGKPVPATGVKPPTGTSVPGSAEGGTQVGNEPTTDNAPPAGGAGVLWSIMHFFGAK